MDGHPAFNQTEVSVLLGRSQFEYQAFTFRPIARSNNTGHQRPDFETQALVQWTQTAKAGVDEHRTRQFRRVAVGPFDREHAA